MDEQRINDEYFEWMCELICSNRYAEAVSYRKLLAYLHSIEFTYSIPRDKNRAEDGLDLRYRFAYETNIKHAEDYIHGPCSVLEMMVALAIRCEENIMDDPSYGNRTGQWFWGMIVNLGLGFMTDSRFDEQFVDDVIFKFLNREYESDGKGGLFTVRNCKYDLRTVEIWYQMCWYLDTFVY